jgi:hypothetical protein
LSVRTGMYVVVLDTTLRHRVCQYVQTCM